MPDGTPTSGPAPLFVQLDATRSSCRNGCVDFSWDFGDGTSEIHDGWIGHGYSTAGVYTVTLTAREMSGATANATTQVIVGSRAPQPPFPNGPPGTPAWTQVLQGKGMGWLTSLSTDSLGNIYGAIDASDQGSYTGQRLVKFAPDGAIQWLERWAGGGETIVANPAGDGFLLAAWGYFQVFDRDGAYVQTISNSFGAIARSNTGDLAWTDLQSLRVLRADGLGWELPSSRLVDALAFDPAGNLFVAGRCQDYECSRGRAQLLKLSPAGTLLWQRGITGTQPVDQLSVLGDGSIVAESSMDDGFSWEGQPFLSGYGTALFAVDPDGQLSWAKSLTSGVRSLATDANGRIALSGPSNAQCFSPEVMALTPSGDPLWTHVIGDYGCSPSLGWSLVSTLPDHGIVTGLGLGARAPGGIVFMKLNP